MSVLTPAGRVGPHCKLGSFASIAKRARLCGPQPASARSCACWSCGCRYVTFAPAVVCDPCADGLHCTNASAIPAESAVSVRAALAFGDWRLWTAPLCGRCSERLPAGHVARIYHAGDEPAFTGHRTAADCVTASLGDVKRLLAVLRRLHLPVGIADRKGVLA